MNQDATLYSSFPEMPTRDGKIFLDRFIPALQWNEGEDVIMDIGCGPGTSALQHILPMIPNIKCLIGIDNAPSMIEMARIQNSHPKITYHYGDIQDKSTLEEWRGKISKIISILCFSWLEDQKTAFINTFDLLQENGEAILYFTLNTPLFDACQEISNSSKWKKFAENVKSNYPESQKKGYRSSHYKEFLEKTGFSVLVCQEEKKTFCCPSDAFAREYLTIFCHFLKYIEEDLKDDFKDDFFETIMKYIGRDEAGRPLADYEVISLHLCKPS